MFKKWLNCTEPFSQIETNLEILSLLFPPALKNKNLEFGRELQELEASVLYNYPLGILGFVFSF